LFDENASKESFSIKGENFKYLVKVRRHSEGDEIYFRSQNNVEVLYRYKIASINNRSLDVVLLDSRVYDVKASKKLHIGWCQIDPKSVERALPSLCEIGVDKITFIECQRSQKNFKVDIKRLQRIIYSSMQQNGRSSFMEFEHSKSLKDFLTKYPDAKVFDFCENTLEDYTDISTVVVGCEGGFGKEEREFLSSYDVFSLKTPMVLRSQSAVLAVASKVLV